MRHDEKGAILITVLWASMILALLAASTLGSVRSMALATRSLTVAAHQKNDLRNVVVATSALVNRSAEQVAVQTSETSEPWSLIAITLDLPKDASRRDLPAIRSRLMAYCADEPEPARASNVCEDGAPANKILEDLQLRLGSFISVQHAAMELGLPDEVLDAEARQKPVTTESRRRRTTHNGWELRQRGKAYRLKKQREIITVIHEKW